MSKYKYITLEVNKKIDQKAFSSNTLQIEVMKNTKFETISRWPAKICNDP